MQTGLTLPELAGRIMSLRSGNRDFIADTGSLHMNDSAELKIEGLPRGELGLFGVRKIAHEQVAEKAGIPFKYYERMRAEQPALLARNVNTWFHQNPIKRLVRTNGGEIRALLSETYRPLDNYDVAEHLIPKLAQSGLELVSSQVTESRLYIQAKTARLVGEVKEGDAVQAGVVITNSEVGAGSLSISEFWYRLVCLNGMVGENLVRQAHVGGTKRAGVTMAEEVFTTETRRATDKAFWLQSRDTIDALLSQGRFDKRLEQMRAAAGVKIGDPVKAVEKVVELLDLTETEGTGILSSLASGGDLSLWGMANAVTAQAHGSEISYDRSFEFEKLGHKVLELPANTFGNN